MQAMGVGKGDKVADHGAQRNPVRRVLLRHREARRRLRAAELPREERRAHVHVQQLRDEGALRRPALPRALRLHPARAHDRRATDLRRRQRRGDAELRGASRGSTSRRRSGPRSTTPTRRSSSTRAARRRCRRASCSPTWACPSTSRTPSHRPTHRTRTRMSSSCPCRSTTSPARPRCSPQSGRDARW